jgi:phage terminase large subunit GpA-like protein
VIEAHEKFALVRNAARDGGGWIAEAPAPGKYPSYHFDALSSPFVPWDTIAERWIAAQTDPAKLKAFYNLTLGLAFDMKGDAPDHVRLMERREDYRRGVIPPRGLMLVGACDVQMRGMYVEIVAYAPNRESWVVDFHVIEGDTTNPHAGAFLRTRRGLRPRISRRVRRPPAGRRVRGRLRFPLARRL